MSSQNYTPPTVLQRKAIVPRSFYIRTEKTEWYPEGIIKLYRMTRSPPVLPNSEFCYQSVRVRNPEELSTLKISMDWLASSLGWQELPEALENFKNQLTPNNTNTEETANGTITEETLKLVRQYPNAANEILRAFDGIHQSHMEIEDIPTMIQVTKTAATLLSNQTKHMIDSKIELLEQLSREKTPNGIKKLTNLLEDYELPQLTSVANIIMDRLHRISLLKATIENENAYEIKGKESVHNQLVNALWIIDDSYWLLYSNTTLAKFLSNEDLPKEDAKKRPDIICANDRKRLVIVELKRPSHRITQKDISQLLNYIVNADKYQSPGFEEKFGYIIGKEISPHDREYINNIPRLKFLPYVQLVEECERRYQEYLDALKEEELKE